MLEELLDRYSSRQRLRDYLAGFIYALNLERRAGRQPSCEEQRVIAFYMAMCVAPTAPIYKLVRLADQLAGIY